MVTTRIDLGVEYLGGMRKPTADDVGKLAVVALDSLGNPNFEYLEQTASVADDTFATTLAPHLRGIGLNVDASGNLRPIQRPRRYDVAERFIGGLLTSGNIGKYGWSLLGTGTPAFARLSGDLQSSSRCSLTTTTGASDTAVLCLGETLSRTVQSAALTERVHFVHNFNSDTANKRVFLGFSTDFATAPASVSGCIGFLYDAGVSGNWQVIARSSGVGTPTDTGVAVSAAGAELLTIYQPTSGTYQFYSGNTLIGSITSGTPTGAMNFGVQLMNLSAAARNHRLGGIWLLSSPLGGAYDDDAFLEV